MVTGLLCLIALIMIPLLIKEWGSYEKWKKEFDEKKNKKSDK